MCREFVYRQPPPVHVLPKGGGGREETRLVGREKSIEYPMSRDNQPFRSEF